MIHYSVQKLTDADMLATFPEAKQIVPAKIRELESDRRELMIAIQLFRQAVQKIAKQEKKDDFFVWFWRDAYIKYFIASGIVSLDKRIIALKMLRKVFSTTPNSQQYEDWNELKQRAKAVSLEVLASNFLNKPRRYGNQIKALCPFHTEKTPSFVIYLKQNTYHCYGCQAHGDSIAFLMNTENINFREAVRRLVRIALTE